MQGKLIGAGAGWVVRVGEDIPVSGDGRTDGAGVTGREGGRVRSKQVPYHTTTGVSS